MGVLDWQLEPCDIACLQALCGPLDGHLYQIERALGVEIRYQGFHFFVKGAQEKRKTAQRTIQNVYKQLLSDSGQQPTTTVDSNQIHLAIKEAHSAMVDMQKNANVSVKTIKGTLKPRTPNQNRYFNCMVENDVTLGVGPAGVGKTYLAVALAIHALETQQVNRIVLTRPAVEAGENLGFLPGDFSQKVDPYLRPLYDALFDLCGEDKTQRWLERQLIEIAPLAYMRGRTLNDAFIILDEGQNTTVKQMMMLLTRMGFNSKIVVTGDISQIDLPKHCSSGLCHAIEVLCDVDGVAIHRFTTSDVVRHPVVARIVDAYQIYS